MGDSEFECLTGNSTEGLENFWTDPRPVLPACFRHTVLIWIPCCLFWLTVPFEIGKLRFRGSLYKESHRAQAKPHSKWNIYEYNCLTPANRKRRLILLVFQMIFLGIMLISSLVRTISINNSDHFLPGILAACIICLLTMAMMITVTILRYLFLMSPPSYCTWITLCAFAICGLPEFISSIVGIRIWNTADLGTVSYFVYYPAIYLSLISFSISDQPTYDQWPEPHLSLPNTLVFWWIFKLLRKGYHSVLSLNDVFRISEQEMTIATYSTFEKHIRKCFGVQRKSIPGDWSMLVVFIRTFYKPVLAGGLLQLFNALLILVSPLVATWLMEHTSNKNDPTWHGYLYVVIFFSATLLRSFANQHHYHLMNKFGIRARSAIVAALYNKVLNMSPHAKQTTSAGEIMNLMAVDSMRFVELAPWFHLLWSAMLQVSVGLYFIYRVVGHAVWAGVGVLVIIFICTSIVSKEMQKLQADQYTEKDRRMKLISEILDGMKLVKLYAWEPAFERLINLIREKELSALKKSSSLFGSIQVSYCCTNMLACLAIFGVYCRIGPTGNLTPEIAFLVLTVLNIIYIPFTQLPLAATSTMMALTSISRLRNFFANDDLISYVKTGHQENSRNAVKIENCSFAWDSNSEPILKHINLTVQSGQLMAIMGPVGGAKSSLISAISGEMHKKDGEVSVNGSIAYVAQQPWIQNMTVRDNILFGLPYNEGHYNRVVQACALEPDLALLPNGDMTLIGERGSNLSGGQKQRISLARAVYQERDIYLLDDPLSAVDVHVGKSIFDAVIGPDGLLSHKTRIFVTHGINYALQCDAVALLVDGTLAAFGSFDELAKSNAVYAKQLEQLAQVAHGEGPEKAMARGDQNTDPDSVNLQDSRFASEWSLRLSRSLSIESFVAVNVPGSKTESLLDDEEDADNTQTPWKTYWLYARYGGKYLLLHGIFAALSCFSYTGGSVWLEIWTDSIPQKPQSTSFKPINHTITGSIGVGVLGIFVSLQFLMTLVVSIFFVFFLIRASSKIHTGLLTSILRAPMSFFDTTPIGRLTNRFGKDINTIDNQIPMSVSAVIQSAAFILSFIIPIIYASPYFIIGIIPLFIVYILLQKFYIASSRQFRRLEAITRSPIYSHFHETINGIATIRTFKQEMRFAFESERLVDLNDSVQMNLLTSAMWLGIQLDFIGNLVITGTALSAVLSRSWISPGLVGLSISFALGITDLLNWSMQESSVLQTELVALERIDEYSRIEAEADWESQDHQITSIQNWPTQGAIEFRNYSTRYKPGLPLVLNSFSCHILAGEKVGIVGRTGAGKSSLSLALFRLIEPMAGTILIDQFDICLMGLHDLRKKLTIIPQEPVLFSGTLRQNIDPFEQHKDDELLRALRLSHLQTLVDKGLDFEIVEGGGNLRPTMDSKATATATANGGSANATATATANGGTATARNEVPNEERQGVNGSGLLSRLNHGLTRDTHFLRVPPSRLSNLNLDEWILEQQATFHIVGGQHVAGGQNIQNHSLSYGTGSWAGNRNPNVQIEFGDGEDERSFYDD